MPKFEQHRTIDEPETVLSQLHKYWCDTFAINPASSLGHDLEGMIINTFEGVLERKIYQPYEVRLAKLDLSHLDALLQNAEQIQVALPTFRTRRKLTRDDE